jgi:predicted transcriptional regulator
MKTIYDITKREKDILNVLWKYDEPMTASEIARADGMELSISTTQTVLRNLSKKNLVQVDGIVYSGKVLSRCYTAKMSVSDFEMNRAVSSFQSTDTKCISATNFVASLLEAEKDTEKALKELDQLDSMLQKKRSELTSKMKKK